MKHKYDFNEFTDDEIKDIIKEGIKHYRNPKHCLSQFSCEQVAIELQFNEYNTNPMKKEDLDRLWNLYNEVLIALDKKL